MKIAAKISLSFLAMGIALTVVGTGAYCFIARAALIQDIDERLLVTAQSRKAHVETYLKMLEISVAQLSKSIILERFLAMPEGDPAKDGAFRDAMARLKRTKEANPSILAFLLSDSSGKVVASSDPVNIGLDRSDDAYFIGGQKGLYVKDAYYSEIYGEGLIAVSCPVLDSKTGAFLGVLAARIKLDDLGRITTERTGLGETGETYIVNKYGYMITPSRFLRGVVLKEKIDTPNVRRSQSRRPEDMSARPIVVGPDYRGNMTLGTYSYIPKMQWTLIAEVDLDEAYKPLGKMLLLALAIIVFMLLLAWFAGALIAGMISKPLHRLHVGMEAVSAGDLDHKVATDVQDEVGQLSRAFDEMTGELKKKIVTIHTLDKEVAERKKAEEALAMKTAILEAQSETTIDGILIVDDRGKMLLSNRRFAEMWAIPADIIRTRDDKRMIRYILGQLAHPDKFAERVRYLYEHVTEKARDEIEFNDGRIIDRYSAPLSDAKGAYQGRIWYFRDVTAERKAATALREASEKYRTLFESSRDAIMVLTPERGFFDANDATIKLFGCRDKAEFISKGPADLSPRYQPDGKRSDLKAQEMMAAALVKGSNFFEWTHKRIDGREFFATVLLTRMDLGGRQVLQATVRDITAEKRSAALIASAAEEWTTTFDAVAEGVSVHGPDFTILNVNAAICELLGREKGEIIGRKCYEVFHHSDTPADGCPLERARMTGKKERMEIFEPSVNRWLDVSVSPIHDDKGVITKIIHVIRDITDRKNAEAKVAEAMETKAQFISTVSHELRTPLTAIKEGIGIVLDGSAGAVNNDQKEFLDLAKRNVDRLARLINDVLDYQRLEAGRAPFRMRKGDIDAVVNEVIRVMRPVAKNKGLSLESRLAPDLPEIIFDKDKITQVLINLANNALKFTEKGGVVIAVSADAAAMTVSVKDTGKGIKKEDIPKLFQGFSQVESSGPKAQGSTGLGLAISKKIVQEHKGNIWIESEYGKGSEFKFTLPVKTRYKILIVDDDRGILDLCRKYLGGEEYDVSIVDQGMAALRMIQDDRPDLCVLDMRLRDINGYEIIGRLRANKETSSIPILAMSGHPDELGKLEDRREDSSLASIAKPFVLQDFLVAIRVLLRQGA